MPADLLLPANLKVALHWSLFFLALPAIPHGLLLHAAERRPLAGHLEEL
jgi:hypothetical protein